MQNPKILILLMSCNQDFFIEEESIVKETWLQSIIGGEYPDIDYYFYTSGEHNHIDHESHKIYVESDDDWYHTFYKTKLAMKLAMEYKDYDYIIRPNLSTYINVDLMYKFIHMLYVNNDNYIWGQDMCKHTGTYYLIGKLLMFPKSRVNEIINCDVKFDNQVDADDYVYGCLFNDRNVFKSLASFYAMPRPYCIFNYNVYDENFNPAVLHSIIAYSYKVYSLSNPNDYEIRRDTEKQMAYKLHEYMGNYKATKTDLIDLIKYKNRVCYVHNYGYEPYIP